MKVITLVGTRPELIKLSLTIAELDRQVEHRLVHTGQNYDFELNEVFFKDLGIRKPDHFLEAAGGSAARTIAKVIERFDAVLEAERPDAMLLLGDTNSCLGVIAAKRRRVPIFHMEAGNRCFDARVPEEINRKIIDHTSDINLAYTEHARRYLLAEGVRPETVFVTGSPMRQVLQHFAGQIGKSDVKARMGLKEDGYFVASAHREENVDDPARLTMLMAALEALAEAHKLPVLFSAHPRTQERLDALPNRRKSEGIRIVKPLGFHDYISLQKDAYCVVSDSGTLTEEAAILGLPAVMIRDATERPEGMDEGTVVMCGLKPERVLDAVRLVRAHKSISFRAPRDYEADNVSAKVVRIILSYTAYVRRVVWREG